MNINEVHEEANGQDIAIIGIAGRFPGAANIDEYWNVISQGINSIKYFSAEELISAGIDKSLVENPDYVKASAVMDDIDKFDSSFFGFAPREADLIDPQHRVFMECAWEALEHSGYSTEEYNGIISVFAGASINYYLFSLSSTGKIVSSISIRVISVPNWL